jgi:hypothetical protein
MSAFLIGFSLGVCVTLFLLVAAIALVEAARNEGDE